MPSSKHTGFEFSDVLGAPLSITSQREVKEHGVLPCGNFGNVQLRPLPFFLPLFPLRRVTETNLGRHCYSTSTHRSTERAPGSPFEPGSWGSAPFQISAHLAIVEESPFSFFLREVSLSSLTLQNCHPDRSKPTLFPQLRSCEVVGLRRGGTFLLLLFPRRFRSSLNFTQNFPHTNDR